MSKTMIKPVAAAVGFALAGSLSVANLANAAENPFGTNQLSQGYLQLADAKMGEGKCGEGKCGGAMKAEAKSGGEKMGEGKCGGEKMPAEAMKAAEGKCGEGKCGGAK
jgi:uncharacterized low-complexity protein